MDIESARVVVGASCPCRPELSTSRSWRRPSLWLFSTIIRLLDPIMLIKTSFKDVAVGPDGKGTMRCFVIEPNVPEYPEARFPGVVVFSGEQSCIEFDQSALADGLGGAQRSIRVSARSAHIARRGHG